jgi:hypothetical protein
MPKAGWGTAALGRIASGKCAYAESLSGKRSKAVTKILNKNSLKKRNSFYFNKMRTLYVTRNTATF